MRTESVAIGRITVADRNRHDLGDIQSLADSISRIGLLHPIGVTEDYRLIFGQRRLAACAALGMTEIRASIVSNLSEAGDLLIAERDENTCRKEMLPSELVALGKAIETLERPKALARMSDGGKGGSTEPPLRARDAVGEALGVSGVTYMRMKAVVDQAENETRSERERSVARQMREEMDAGARSVTSAYRTAMAARQNQDGAVETAKPTRVQKLGRHIPAQEVLDRGIRELAIAADVLDGIDTLGITATEDQIRTLNRAISTLRSVKRALTGGNNETA